MDATQARWLRWWVLLLPPIAGGQDDGSEDDGSGLEGGSAGAGAPGPGGVNAGGGAAGNTAGGGFGGLNTGDTFGSGGFGTAGFGGTGLNAGDTFGSGGFGFGGFSGPDYGTAYGGDINGPMGYGAPSLDYSGSLANNPMGLSASSGAVGALTNAALGTGTAPSQADMNAALQQDINASLQGPPAQTGTPLFPSLASIPFIGGLLQKGVTGLGALLGMGPATGPAVGAPNPGGTGEGNAQAGLAALTAPTRMAAPPQAAGGAPVNASAQATWPGAVGSTGSGPWPGTAGASGASRASAATGGVPVSSGTPMAPAALLPADPLAAYQRAVYQYGANSPQANALLPYLEQQFANPQGYRQQVAQQQQAALANQVAQQVRSQMGTGAGTGTATGGPASTQGATGTDNVQSKLLSAYDQLIPFLQSPSLLDTPEGQAVYASASNQINAQYNRQRQQVLTRAAQQGLDPRSGVVQQELAQLDQQKQADLSNVQNYYTQQYTQNMETSVSALTNLLNLDNAQNAQGLADQMAIDQFDQQTVTDLLQGIGVGEGALNNVSSNAANISGNLLLYASQLGAQYTNLAANSYSGLGSIASALASGGFGTGGTSGLGSSVNGFSTVTPTAAPESSIIGSPNLMSLMA